ncbi:ABC transporter substrate-binding protein [Paraglaciecola chathamensis]|uniref:ABC transporter substrate-binding protein n=1 Tax=Paraglaciecola chathamensis TaxID=368405 RepID=UPI0026F4EA32|nr:extracellular solute-binding protein [Paraglaciecola chathamensis]MDO6557806.1 extracellular solute-binding protein [Paraglaciecola chathamensis]
MLNCRHQWRSPLIFFYSCILGLLISSSVLAQSIEVAILSTSGPQKSSFLRHAKSFEAQYPGSEVILSFYSDADFKKSIVKWLSQGSGPDILTWQGGPRLYQYVRKNQVKDLSRLWSEHGLDASFSEGAIGAISLNNKRYAIPTSYYQWGFYYRQSVFDGLNLQPPADWKSFLNVCETLKNAGITPITIGAANKWTSAAWFDYLNLRINGLDYHQRLLQGEIPFTDKGVRDVFEKWKLLLDKGYFTTRYNGWDWQQAMPFMYHKMAGMTLIGNFFAGGLPPLLKEDFRFFPFPQINPAIPAYEEAPMDLLMVPNYTKMNKTVEHYLLSIAGLDFQKRYNDVSSMISPNKRVQSKDDYFIKQGQKILNNAAGLSQFFDRDTNEKMGSAGTIIFTEFMDSRNIDATLSALENARQTYLL